MTPIEAAQYLSDLKSDLHECRCAKSHITRLIRLLKNDYERTFILNIPHLQTVIMRRFPDLMTSLSKYIAKRDHDPIAPPNLWKMYEILGNQNAPEVIALKKARKAVYDVFQSILTDIETEAKTSGPDKHQQKGRKRSQNPKANN